MKPLYIAAYHQSVFGKLMGVTVPEIVRGAVAGACGEIGVEPRAIDVGSIGAVCNFSLNEQGLLAGPRGQGARPRGQADRVGRERLRLGRPGRPLRRPQAAGGRGRDGHRGRLREDARRRRARWTASSSARSSATSRTPTSAPGKVFVFPHLFAEVMDLYMRTHGVTEEDLAPHRGAGVRATRSTTRTRRCGRSSSRSRRPDDRGHQPLHRRGPAAEDLRLLADHRRLRRPRPRHRGGPRAARRREEGRLRASSRAAARPPTRCARRGATCCGRPGRLRGDEQGLRDGRGHRRRRERGRGARLLHGHGRDRHRGASARRALRPGRALLGRRQGRRRRRVRRSTPRAASSPRATRSARPASR